MMGCRHPGGIPTICRETSLRILDGPSLASATALTADYDLAVATRRRRRGQRSDEHASVERVRCISPCVHGPRPGTVRDAKPTAGSSLSSGTGCQYVRRPQVPVAANRHNRAAPASASRPSAIQSFHDRYGVAKRSVDHESLSSAMEGLGFVSEPSGIHPGQSARRGTAGDVIGRLSVMPGALSESLCVVVCRV